MYYATQTSVPGAPGNLAPYTPVPQMMPQMGPGQYVQHLNHGMGGNVQVIAPSANTPVINYSSPDAIGNMVGMAKAGGW